MNSLDEATNLIKEVRSRIQCICEDGARYREDEWFLLYYLQCKKEGRKVDNREWAQILQKKRREESNKRDIEDNYFDDTKDYPIPEFHNKRRFDDD